MEPDPIHLKRRLKPRSEASRELVLLLGAQAGHIPEPHLAEHELRQGGRVVEPHAAAELVGEAHQPSLVSADDLVRVVIAKPCLVR